MHISKATGVCVAVLSLAIILPVQAHAQSKTRSFVLQNVDPLMAKYELVEFMSRRSYAGGVHNMDSLVFRKPVRNPYASLLQGGGIEHNLTDEISFEIVPSGPKIFTVYFNFDKSGIRSSEQPTVRAAIRYIQTVNPRRVRVIGHADRSGSNPYNQGLSQRRAATVASALRASGIGVEFRGETDNAVRTRDGVRLQANRRAAIIVITGSDVGAVPGKGVRVVATRRFYARPATPKERQVRPLVLWPFDPSLEKILSKFRRHVSRDGDGS